MTVEFAADCQAEAETQKSPRVMLNQNSNVVNVQMCVCVPSMHFVTKNSVLSLKAKN